MRLLWALELLPSSLFLLPSLSRRQRKLFLLPSTIKCLPSIMPIISDAIQDKCLAFSDRIIKLNDYLLEQASEKYDVRSKMSLVRGRGELYHPFSII